VDDAKALCPEREDSILRWDFRGISTGTR